MQISKNRKEKNQEIEDQKYNDRKTPQTGPKSSSVDTFTSKPSKPSIQQLGNQCSASPEADQKFDTPATLLEHKDKETLEDISYLCKKKCLPKLSTQKLYIHQIIFKGYELHINIVLIL